MLTHIGTQTIETERLILRRFEYSDIDSMLRNWIADEQTQWDYGEPYYPTSDDVQQLFDTKYIVSYSCKDYYRWAVIEKTSGECIGQIAFFLVDNNNHHGEIEYVIVPAIVVLISGQVTSSLAIFVASSWETYSSSLSSLSSCIFIICVAFALIYV